MRFGRKHFEVPLVLETASKVVEPLVFERECGDESIIIQEKNPDEELQHVLIPAALAEEPPSPIQVAPSVTPHVYVLLATIPARKRSCERLFGELTKQSRPPDGVILCLDGYGETPRSATNFHVPHCRRTSQLSGAGQRWLCVEDLYLPDGTIIINVDDDAMLSEAPRFIEALVSAVTAYGGAAAAMGRSADGKQALPGNVSRGVLIYAAGCGLAVRVHHLRGLRAFAEGVVKTGGPDALGVRGDDDALVSAFLWKQDVTIFHAPTGNVYAAPGTHISSQTAAKNERRETPDAQKIAIKKITGWPWPTLH